MATLRLISGCICDICYAWALRLVTCVIHAKQQFYFCLFYLCISVCAPPQQKSDFALLCWLYLGRFKKYCELYGDQAFMPMIYS